MCDFFDARDMKRCTRSSTVWADASGGDIDMNCLASMFDESPGLCAEPQMTSRAPPICSSYGESLDAPMTNSAAPRPSVPDAPPTSLQPAELQPRQDSQAGGGGGAVIVDRDGQRDFTQVPQELDALFAKLDADNALRPTIIKPGDVWSKREKKKLLAAFSSRRLQRDDQKKEKNAAFDLLDALTKSGAIPVEQASLHVLVAVTHAFDRSVLETVVQENVNPIEKVERSLLILGSTVHQRPVPELLQAGQQPRVEAASPQLFIEQL